MVDKEKYFDKKDGLRYGMIMDILYEHLDKEMNVTSWEFYYILSEVAVEISDKIKREENDKV